MDQDFEVIGKGNIGEKARQLIEKTPKLKEIGFHAPKRTILAQDFFDGFFQRNGLGSSLENVGYTENLEEKIKKGSLTKEEFQTLQRIASSYNVPLAIRSSAEGDARGTGTYDSRFSSNHIKQVRPELLTVLASYFSADAIAFRQDSKSGEGFGIMIEPLVGQQFDYIFAPVYSGYGYTSTSRGAGYISMVSGMLAGVASKEGEKITEELVRGGDDDFIRIVMDLSDRSSDKGRDPLGKLLGSWDYCYGYSEETIVRTSNSFYKNNDQIEKARNGLKLSLIFEYMKSMEDSFGKPQYFEWAMTMEGGKPKWHILQIADASKKTDIFDFNDQDGKRIFDCHTVTGSGIKEGRDIFVCLNSYDIEQLHQFNQQNRDYALFFSSRLTTGGSTGAGRGLRYSDYNHASVFIELQDAPHLGDPIAHLEGQLAEAGKFFGVFDGEDSPGLDLFFASPKLKEESGGRVYQGKIKTIAGERQDKMQVFDID